jgi:stage II sporulation protein P
MGYLSASPHILRKDHTKEEACPMRFSGKLAFAALAALLGALLSTGGYWERAAAFSQARVDAGRMENVVLLRQAPSPSPSPSTPPSPSAALPIPAPASELPEDVRTPLSAELASAPGAERRETTITGDRLLKNETGYEVDPEQLLRDGPQLRLPAEGPQILILHTHGSEAYTPAGLDRYESSDPCRTEDDHFNVIRVGDELAARLEEAGLRVLHDREIYDYPSYTGSYGRSGEAVERYLAQYPDIAVVIDLHRDALGDHDVIYKTMAEEPGTVASQIMLLVGTDDSGLEHPNWRSNLALALYLQDAVSKAHPTLLRPVDLVPQRYNQHLTGGSLILEVGSSGNTLQEALAAVRLFADAAGPALLALVEGGEL